MSLHKFYTKYTNKNGKRKEDERTTKDERRTTKDERCRTTKEEGRTISIQLN